MAKSKALGGSVTASAENESTEAQVIEVTCPKHAQTLKFPVWWALYSSSRQRHGSEPTHSWSVTQTLGCLSVNHLGYCPEGLSTMPNEHPENIPHIQGPTNKSLGKHLSCRGKNMLIPDALGKPQGECGTADWPHQVPT